MNQKKFLLSALLLTLFIGKALGQGFTFGPKAGLTYLTLPSNLSTVSNDAGKAGFQAGLFFRFGNKTYIQPEFLYQSQSASFDFSPSGISSGIAQNVKFTSFDIPVLIGTKLVSLPLFNLRMFFGPDFEFQFNKPGLQIPNPSSYSYKDANVGGSVGLGIDLASFTLDGRYNFGLSQINPSLGQRANTINLSLGLKFL